MGCFPAAKTRFFAAGVEKRNTSYNIEIILQSWTNAAKCVCIRSCRDSSIRKSRGNPRNSNCVPFVLLFSFFRCSREQGGGGGGGGGGKGSRDRFRGVEVKPRLFFPDLESSLLLPSEKRKRDGFLVELERGVLLIRTETVGVRG